MSESYKDESRKPWRTKEGAPTVDELKLGCLQRIADASELMAKERERLEWQAKYYFEQMRKAHASEQRHVRSNIALRGVITKLKKKLEAAQ